MRRFEAAGVPAGPVASLQEMLTHSQTIEREMVTEVQHSTLGPVKTLGFPIKLGAGNAAIDRCAPRLVEDTLEVLLENGYTKTSVAELQRSSIIICA